MTSNEVNVKVSIDLSSLGNLFYKQITWLKNDLGIKLVSVKVSSPVLVINNFRIILACDNPNQQRQSDTWRTVIDLLILLYSRGKMPSLQSLSL